MVDKALAEWVRERANHCCEYCRFPQAFSSTAFQIDHIFARQHGGRTVAANLALACLAEKTESRKHEKRKHEKEGEEYGARV
jgi:5-methylcytosine-specific restriction endonuclease McrA